MHLVRSSPLRVALAFSFGLILTTYAVFAVVGWRFYRSNVALTASFLQDDAVRALDATPDQLRERLALRLTQDLHHLDYAGLYDRKGALVFGNAPSELNVPADGRSHFVSVTPAISEPKTWRSDNAIFVAQRRMDGGVLVLGRSLVNIDQLNAAMRRAFFDTVVPVVIVALLVGVWVSVRASRRLSRINEAITRVMDGDLFVRLPSRDSISDVDELCRSVNLMLDEIGRLVGQIRSVGDNIAHDLRAPLAVMRARLERGLAGSSETLLRNMTSEALGDLERAMTTVTALLRISNLESGIRRGAFAPVDLGRVCHDAYDLFQPLAEAKSIALKVEVGQQLIVPGDADLLHEALANLIDNAIKFTPAGGTVRVEAGHPRFLLRVSDTGPGVPAWERGKVVKRFYRSEATSDTPGVGLGLSMTATIVDLHGFHLDIDSSNPGAVFTISVKDRDSVPVAERVEARHARNRVPVVAALGT